jgi:hypothetical protein
LYFLSLKLHPLKNIRPYYFLPNTITMTNFCMRQRLWLWLICLLCIPDHLLSQTLYELSYRFTVENEPRDFDALLVKFEDGTGFMIARKVFDGSKASNVVKMNLEEQTILDATGRQDTTQLLLESTGAQQIDLSNNFMVMDVGGKTTSTEALKKDDELVYLNYRGAIIRFGNSGNGVFTPSQVVSPYGDKTQSTVISHSRYLGELTVDELMQVLKEYMRTDDPLYKNLRFATTQPMGNTRGGVMDLNPRLIKMHLLIVANTNDISIGSTCAIDRKAMEDYFKQIAQFLGLSFNSKIISGKTYSKKKVDAALKALKPASRDIVVFYYTGHGFSNLNDKFVLPYLDLRAKSYQKYGGSNALNMEEITATIKNKGSRLNLIFSDCCNSDPNSSSTIIPNVATTRTTSLGWNEKFCRQLFMNTDRQTIVMTAAQIGQVSAGNNNVGGIFTYNLRASLEKYLGPFNASVSWSDILMNIKNQTAKKAANTLCPQEDDTYKPCVQTPVFIIE